MNLPGNFLLIQVKYDKTYTLGRVPYTDVPYEVYNLETGGPRPRAYLDERYKSVEFKVKNLK